MTDIQIKRGQYYEVRDPEKVRSMGFKTVIYIIRMSGMSAQSFFGDDNNYYHVSGVQTWANDPAFDLVKEIKSTFD